MSNGNTGRIVFARLQENDDVADSIRKHAEKSGIKAGAIILIGALKQAVLGCYKEGEYITNRFNGHLEVAACTGNIALDDNGETFIHAHMVISDERGETHGGHLMRGSLVGPTAELTIIEASGINLQRAFDEKTKLRLLKLG